MAEKRGNPKLETLNPKQIQNVNVQILKTRLPRPAPVGAGLAMMNKHNDVRPGINLGAKHKKQVCFWFVYGYTSTGSVMVVIYRGKNDGQ